MHCAIWYHLYNFKHVKNTYGGGVTFSKVAGFKPATLQKVALLHGCFSRFLNCTNDTKSRKASFSSQITIPVKQRAFWDNVRISFLLVSRF